MRRARVPKQPRSFAPPSCDGALGSLPPRFGAPRALSAPIYQPSVARDAAGYSRAGPGALLVAVGDPAAVEVIRESSIFTPRRRPLGPAPGPKRHRGLRAGSRP